MLDALVGNSLQQGNQVWFNDGTGAFVAGATLGEGDTNSVALGDVDSDGDLDALAANWNGQDNVLWLNDGAGDLTAVQLVGSGFASQVVMEDIDSDGDVDVFLAMFHDAANEVWRNTTDPLDFNDDGAVGAEDIDALFTQINGGDFNPMFDVNHDSLITPTDVDAMLRHLGTRPGDADLNGVVDGVDFMIWNSNKSTGDVRWATADFNGDGATDGRDFLIWRANQQVGANSLTHDFRKRMLATDDDNDESQRTDRGKESTSGLFVLVSVFSKPKDR